MFYSLNRQISENDFYSVYVVKKGDTLSKIAREYNVNLKLLAELNGVKTTEYIYPNEVILIPKKGVQFYITKEDDTLGTVEDIFGVSEFDIVSQNKEIFLLPGQMIFYKN